MLMLAMHPELQERVYEECKSIQIADGEDIKMEDMSDLKYLDMFVKETLRMFPSVPYLTRITTSDFAVGSCSFCGNNILKLDDNSFIFQVES